MNKKIVKIFLDANVLIDFATGQKDAVDTLNFLFKKRRKEVLFTSSLALCQMISTLQTKKKSRKAFTKRQVIEVLKHFQPKLSVLDLKAEDIVSASYENSNDYEDCVQYVISQKRKCDAVLTSNTSDFIDFDGIVAISPKLSLVSQLIK